MKHFHEVLAGTVHECSLKLSIGIVRENRPGGLEESAQAVPDIPYDSTTILQEKAPRGRLPVGQYKLTPRQAASLRAKRQRGAPLKALMEEYGISRATLFRYLQ